MTTNWTLVTSAREDQSALGELLETYWSPVYAYVRRAGHNREDAAELTQEFITEVVLKRDLVARADPGVGTFRAYLKTALRNFIVDQRRAKGTKRAGSGAAVSDPAILDAIEPSPGTDPADAYDRQWAKTVLTMALERVRRDCAQNGLATHWKVFERRVLSPEMRGGEPPSLAVIATEFGLSSSDIAAGMIFTVKRKLRAAIQSAIAETVSTSGELEAEIAALRQALSS